MGKRLVIVGFGNQAKTWAHNLQDKGYHISVYLKDGSSKAELASKTFSLITKNELSHHDCFALLIPDDQHLSFLQHHQQFIPKSSRIIYAHGFSVFENHLQNLYPQFDHLLLAPKGIAHSMRQLFLQKISLAGVYSAEFSTHYSQVENEKYLINLSKDLGIFFPKPSNFQEETHADLFSEQSLLCGYLPYLIEENFKFMLQQGLSADVCFYETFYEMNLIMQTIAAKGPQEFFKMISPNAAIGAYLTEKKLPREQWSELHRELWGNIKSGDFFDQIRKISYPEVKENLKQHWEKSPLQKTFEKLSPELSGDKNGKA